MKSLLPGTIINILVNEGDMVKKGQPLVIVESMKMENEMQAEKDGIVKKILVKKGEVVKAQQELVEIE